MFRLTAVVIQVFGELQILINLPVLSDYMYQLQIQDSLANSIFNRFSLICF